MKATSRRRLLVSSVAMLLVAMLALGTATYAWFTTSTSATASELSVKTVKASELQLSSTTIEWTDTLKYNQIDKVLKPASSADGVNWFIADATDKNGTAGTVTKKATNAADFGSYVFADQLNVRNNGEATVENVKIKFTLSETEANSGKYLRLALVEANKRGTDAILTGKFEENVYGSAADSAEAFTSEAKAKKLISAKSGANVQFDVGTLIGKSATESDGNVKAKYYNLYIWFEGQDTDCKDANAGNAMPKITFTVEGDTVQA